VAGLIERTELNIFNPDQSLIWYLLEMQIFLTEASIFDYRPITSWWI